MKNTLWKPESQGSSATTTYRVKLQDVDICQYCDNKEFFLPSGKRITCQHPCLYLVSINGKKPLKEKLLPQLIDNDSNYNNVLAENIHLRNVRKINSNKFKQIENLQLRHIAILLKEGEHVKDISQTMKCSVQNIYKLIKKGS